ncbi:MAG TPA: hypothetical protein GXZ90_05365 [Clostridiales bacterium]|nr:hypothetical protein [Clostridiales bacterium]
MEGIYYKNGVYVVIDNDKEHEDCVYHHENKSKAKLYGGRVEIRRYATPYYSHYETLLLDIDGISILKISEYQASILKDLDIAIVTQYLNAIEANGVDAFMQHYKNSLELLQEDLQNLQEVKQSELTTLNESTSMRKINEEIEKIETLLYYLFSIIFTLRTFMSAGLENEKVISVYQSIMDTIA